VDRQLGVDVTASIVAFFEQLARRGHEPMLEEVEGTIRFDLMDAQGTDYWFVEINKGDVRVSRGFRSADCIVHVDRAVADRLAAGELQAQPAWMRGLMWMEGNLLLLRFFDRAFPGPRNAHHPRDLVHRDGEHR
jgi:hypothetical protein